MDPGRARAPEAVPAAAPASPTAPADGSPADGAPTAADANAGVSPDGDEADPLPLPWHFKLLVGAITLYLGWRAVQGVEWVLHRL